MYYANRRDAERWELTPAGWRAWFLLKKKPRKG